MVRSGCQELSVAMPRDAALIAWMLREDPWRRLTGRKHPLANVVP